MSIWDELDDLEDFDPQNRYISDQDLGIRLISELVNRSDQQTAIQQAYLNFKERLQWQFLQEFRTYSYPVCEGVYPQLLELCERLGQWIEVPEVAGKLLVAIGGGFSAGKSHLINSIIGQDILPVDTTPTTSVPTYIMSDSRTICKIVNVYGSTAILDEEAVGALTHAFAQKYRLNLAPLIQHLLIRAKIDKGFPYVVLDTPGYSRSDQHKSEADRDESVARAALNLADAIIWVIDIDKGVIPEDDIRFLQSLEPKSELFIVLNKADVKLPEEIKRVISTVKKTLKDRGIACSGVAAYSSKLKKEYAPDKLGAHLKKLAKSKKRIVDWTGEFRELADIYKKAANDTVMTARQSLAELNHRAVFSSNHTERELLARLITEQRALIAMHTNNVSAFNDRLEPYVVMLTGIQMMIKTPLLINKLIQEEKTAYRKTFILRFLELQTEPLLEQDIQPLIDRMETGELPVKLELQEQLLSRLEHMFARKKTTASLFESYRSQLEEMLKIRSYPIDARDMSVAFRSQSNLLAESIREAVLKRIDRVSMELFSEIPTYPVGPETRLLLHEELKLLSNIMKESILTTREPTYELCLPPELLQNHLPVQGLSLLQHLFRKELRTYAAKTAAALDDDCRLALLEQLSIEETERENSKHRDNQQVYSAV